ncbi:protein TCL1B3-like [Mus caroli]|uniref:Protein TCL1B3-like n=1 Tax=Mus caroli TaxID=10089 RepID=A0A6P5QUR0_MUSCR|nr:protein TCL1B3-like [Mus caroli]
MSAICHHSTENRLQGIGHDRQALYQLRQLGLHGSLTDLGSPWKPFVQARLRLSGHRGLQWASLRLSGHQALQRANLRRSGHLTGRCITVHLWHLIRFPQELTPYNPMNYNTLPWMWTLESMNTYRGADSKNWRLLTYVQVGDILQLILMLWCE